MNMAQKSLARSQGLHKQLDTVLNELSVNEQSTTILKKLGTIEGLREEISTNREWMRGVQEELDGHHDRISNVDSIVEEAEQNVAVVETKTSEFAQAVGEIKERADTITGFNQQAIVQAIKNVTQGKDDVEEMRRVLEAVNGRSDSHDGELRGLRTDLGVLKEKINEAREKASKVKVGVKSPEAGGGGGTCVREYLSALSPSPRTPSC